MLIHGLQKMTLLDYPGHVACTVFLGGCDFRCPYCHNYELADGTSSPVMSENDFFKFLDMRHGLLDGVAVTGGEPCMYKDLPLFLVKIKERGFSVKVDTNGFHPDILSSILSEHLADYVAMDIKNSPEKYSVTSGISNLNLTPIRESIKLLMDMDTDYEFRTTVVKELHESKDFLMIGKWIAGAKRYFLQCFTDRDTVPFGNLHAPSREDLLHYKGILKEYVPDTHIRGVD